MTATAKNPRTAALLIEALLDARALVNLDPPGWERVLSCARRNAVLAYLCERAELAGILEDLPEIPRASLLSARISAGRLAQLARWELDRVRRVLGPLGIPMIALKGIAYVLRGMPHAATRLLSDIDVMVPRDRIDAAEQALLTAGWQGTKLDQYDQKYYRRWSHEIPPLQYPGRLLDLDLHHTICPPVSRLRPDPEQFWANSEESQEAGVRLLSPVDSVLHAAIHLFFDSDFEGRFRDLLDLHELLALFGAEEAFWPALLTRARELGVGRPLYYAFETLTRVLRTPIPAHARHEALQFKPAVVDGWMTRTMTFVLSPADPERWPAEHRARLWLLFVRSHWTRMPAYLLIPHLVRKSVRRLRTVAVDA
jgi:hypothetical protein